MRTFKIEFSSNFQICLMVLSTSRHTVYYIPVTYFVTGSLYLLTLYIHSPPPNPVCGNHQFVLCELGFVFLDST